MMFLLVTKGASVFYTAPPFERPDSGLVRRFLDVEVASLGHVTDFGFPRGLRRVAGTKPFAGVALTVHMPHVDSTAVHRALSLVQPGDVVVVDQSGDELRSSFGGTVAAVAQHKGAVAAIVDGSTNDVGEISELDFPVYSRGATPLTSRIQRLEGEIGVPVSVGGVAVCSGDIVFGDADGVAVVPQRRALQMIERLEAMEERMARNDWLGQALRDEREFAELSGADHD
jgi:regulator of RNase E activity RraA